MVLYARADVDYVFVPAGSGGCGLGHSRPVTSGVPATEFKLLCPGCEDFLRADIARSGGNKKMRTINGDYGLERKERYLGLWGATPDTIPETPDEELARTHNEQVMITKNAASQTETLAQIGAAVAGNAELMAKFIELQTTLARNQAVAAMPLDPILPVPASQSEPGEGPEPRRLEYRMGGFGNVPADGHACKDCGAPIVRADGQKGALPQRCPGCKTKHQTAQRQGYRKTAA
jgi:hypothetical protein